MTEKPDSKTMQARINECFDELLTLTGFVHSSKQAAHGAPELKRRLIGDEGLEALGDADMALKAGNKGLANESRLQAKISLFQNVVKPGNEMLAKNLGFSDRDIELLRVAVDDYISGNAPEAEAMVRQALHHRTHYALLEEHHSRTVIAKSADADQA